jgi:hypothetical protein
MLNCSKIAVSYCGTLHFVHIHQHICKHIFQNMAGIKTLFTLIFIDLSRHNLEFSRFTSVVSFHSALFLFIFHVNRKS